MDLPKRKHPRLKSYDYSLPGYYYVTVHVEKGAPVLSTVRRGLAPATGNRQTVERPFVTLTPVGKIARYQLLELPKRFSNVVIDKYVIMPTHIHMILQMGELPAGASPRPTLMDVVGTYKSLTTREVNRMRNCPGVRLFQSSFYEMVLRNEQAYQKCWLYIDENPDKWFLTPEDW